VIKKYPLEVHFINYWILHIECSLGNSLKTREM